MGNLPINEIRLISFLHDINCGYSAIEHEGATFYLKHPTISLLLEREIVYQKYLQRGIRHGMELEKDVIEDCIKFDKWSQEKEEKVKNLEWSIDKLTRNYSSIKDYLQRLAVKDSIRSKEEELSQLLKERADLVLVSAEGYAHNKTLNWFRSKILFDSLEFNKSLEADDLQSDIIFGKALGDIQPLYEKSIILKVVFETVFFEIFCLFQNDPRSIFNKNGFELTIFQKSCISHGDVLLSKLKNIPDIPDNVRQDPVLLYEYKYDNKKTVEGIDDLKHKAKSGGLTKKDFL